MLTTKLPIKIKFLKFKTLKQCTFQCQNHHQISIFEKGSNKSQHHFQKDRIKIFLNCMQAEDVNQYDKYGVLRNHKYKNMVVFFLLSWQW